MAGRGGFGGRGRGRGRAIPIAVARDEDGTILPTATLTGPPPLYPEIELPDHPEMGPKDKMLLMRRHELFTRSRRSAFFVEDKKELQGIDDGLTDAASKRLKTGRPPLSSIMTLISDFFPEELYSSKEARSSKMQSAKGQIAMWKAQGKDDPTALARLEQLAKLESAAEGGAGKKPGEEEEGQVAEDDALHDTDEEEDMEFDDYYQGEHFDDDEGYGDGFDDGGDEGPTY